MKAFARAWSSDTGTPFNVTLSGIGLFLFLNLKYDQKRFGFVKASFAISRKYAFLSWRIQFLIDCLSLRNFLSICAFFYFRIRLQSVFFLLMALANSLFIQGGLLAPRRGALEMCVSMAANTRSLHCFHASFRSSGVDISSTPALNGSNERSLFKESKSAFLKT